MRLAMVRIFMSGHSHQYHWPTGPVCNSMAEPFFITTFNRRRLRMKGWEDSYMEGVTKLAGHLWRRA